MFYFCFYICRELGRKERESLQKMAEIAKEGFQLKQQLIQEAKRALEDKKVWITRKTFHIHLDNNQVLIIRMLKVFYTDLLTIQFQRHWRWYFTFFFLVIHLMLRRDLTLSTSCSLTLNAPGSHPKTKCWPSEVSYKIILCSTFFLRVTAEASLLLKMLKHCFINYIVFSGIGKMVKI